MINEYEKAIKSYNWALKLNPDSAECHFNIASAYNDHNDLENAVKHYEMAMKFDENNVETYINLA